MGLHKLDFLSNAPRNLTFQNTSNKTNFGGTITLFYIIVVLIISVFYLVDYIVKEDYSIEYIHYIFDSSDHKNIKVNSNNERYNPYFNFSFNLADIDHNVLSKDYKLSNTSELESFIKRGRIYKKRLTDVKLTILYKCPKDEICSIPDNMIYLIVFYNGYIINHQNNTSPIYLETSKEKRFYSSFLLILMRQN